jgi:pimeloyl-ACP methyl ester carboxylesterase/class 3 adenylate cyclase
LFAKGNGMPPAIRYAKSGRVRIAYQVLGSGPLDLVLVPGFISNLDHHWDDSALAQFLARLASFSRLILFDKRGIGLSDRTGHLPTLEERMDDVRAVMDAVGCERAALSGISEGGAMSILFAATYPERTRALVLYGTYGHFPSWVLPPDRLDAFIDLIDRHWGTGASLPTFAPSKVSDEAFRRWWARFERLGVSPSAAIALMRMNNEIDIRHVLPSIRVPTLVLHRTEDPRVNVEARRFFATEHPGREVCRAAGRRPSGLDRRRRSSRRRDRGIPDGLAASGRAGPGVRHRPVHRHRGFDETGHRAWRPALAVADRAARRGSAAADRTLPGREIKTLGDGFLAIFDGPARAARYACGIAEAVRSLGLEVRGGVHTGEVELVEDDIRGVAVHIASRVAGLAAAGEVLVSGTVRDLVAGSGLRFRDRGSHAIKGLPEELRLFVVDGGQP